MQAVRAGPVHARTSRLTELRSVLGLAGELIQVPDVDSWGNLRMREGRVPPCHVWLQGDNTRNSIDSRTYGPVNVGMLRGRVGYRPWPLSRLGPIEADPAFARVLARDLRY